MNSPDRRFCEDSEVRRRASRLRERAQRAAGDGRWGPALALLEDAVDVLPAGVDGTVALRLEILREALDLSLRREGKGADRVLRLASAILAIDDGDPEARVARGVAHVLNSERDGRVVDRARLRQGVRDLERATEAPHLDPDDWGSLGGAYKRLAELHEPPPLDDGRDRAEFQDRVIDAYWQGYLRSPDIPDAYVLLNFLEERAVAGRVSEADFLTSPASHDLDLRESLERALRIRVQQFEHGAESVWAAFDLARGRFYLRRADPEFCNDRARSLFVLDLSTAAREAILAARGPDDRHPLSATRRTLERLRGAGRFIREMDLGLAVLTNMLESDLWEQAGAEPLAHAHDRLVNRIRKATRAQVEALVQIAAERDGREMDLRRVETALRRELASVQDRVHRIEEERWEEGIEELRGDFATTVQKLLGPVGRNFGAAGLAAVLNGIGLPIPGWLLDGLADLIVEKLEPGG